MKYLQKKWIYWMIIACVGWIACEPFTDIPTQAESGSDQIDIPLSALPAPALDFLETNYPNVGIYEVRQRFEDDGSFVYKVELINGIEIYFAPNGSVIKIEHDGFNNPGEHVPVDSLPQGIRDYIAINYPTTFIREAEQQILADSSVRYKIHLNTGVELFFDQEGNFLFLDDDHDGDDNEIEVPVFQLPELILDYVAHHFPFERIVRAQQKFEDGIWLYRIELSNDVRLFFNLEGQFLFSKGEPEDEDEEHEEGEVSVASLPQSVRDYIAANYPGVGIKKAEKEFEDGQWLYEIKLNNGIELYFDLNGTFLWLDD